MISILMPVKNASAFVEETLRSILAQTFEEWELIAVDDHSTDQSKSILETYSRTDKRIKVLANQGNGIIDALSTAFGQSKGTAITRMDADDIMEPTKLAEMHAALLLLPNHIITSKVRYFSADGVGDGYRKYEQWLNSLIDKKNQYSEIYKECVLPSPNWMMSRDTLQALGGFSKLNYPEDYDLCFKAYAANIPIKGLNPVLHLWRDYPERTSRNDDNYADNRFLSLKLKYFIEIDRQSNQELLLLGAGKKGKLIAAELVDKGLDFRWLTNNEKKIGHSIHGVELESDQIFADNSQMIVAIAGEEDQTELRSRLNKLKSVKAFWFC